MDWMFVEHIVMPSEIGLLLDEQRSWPAVASTPSESAADEARDDRHVAEATAAPANTY